MDGLDITAFVLMAFMAAIAIGLFVFLGGWPGRVARRLDHPYADAVSVGGWVTLVLGGVGWPFILIWAYAVPKREPTLSPEKNVATASDTGEEV